MPSRASISRNALGLTPVGRQDEAPCAGAFLQQPDGQALAWACYRGGCDFGGEKIGLERRAAGLRQRAVIICRVEPAVAISTSCGCTPDAVANRFGARQGGGIDEAAEQESVFGRRQCLEARGKMRALPARRKDSATADTGMPPAFSREYLQF